MIARTERAANSGPKQAHAVAAGPDGGITKRGNFSSKCRLPVTAAIGRPVEQQFNPAAADLFVNAKNQRKLELIEHDLFQSLSVTNSTDVTAGQGPHGGGRSPKPSWWEQAQLKRRNSGKLGLGTNDRQLAMQVVPTPPLLNFFIDIFPGSFK